MPCGASRRTRWTSASRCAAVSRPPRASSSGTCWRGRRDQSCMTGRAPTCRMTSATPSSAPSCHPVGRSRPTPSSA
eukprot:7312999-Pyramimonas_sp.AAC.1